MNDETNCHLSFIKNKENINPKNHLEQNNNEIKEDIIQGFFVIYMKI